ncbi:MAG: EF-hand domain-containing protein [Sphingomicrobium sp.]
MHKLLIGGAAAALVALTPAFANGQSGHGMRNKTEARADVQGDVAKMFGRLDANKDGFISTAEIDALAAKRSERHKEKRANFDPDKVFAKIDSNQDGNLTRAEVDAAHAARKGAKPGGNGADRLFARADSNKDGAVTAAEFKAAPKPNWDKAAKGGHGGGKARMLGQADLDKDGKVSQAEAQQAALARFDRADTNKDGKVTPEERRALRAQHKG